jgi:hypothetical protein
MKKKTIFLGVLLLVVVLLLPACGRVTPVPPTPTNDPRPVLTGAAQTAEYRLTQMVQLTPTETPVPPTNTPAPTPTDAPTLEASPNVNITPTATTAPVASAADRSVLASETIPDGTRFTPGATFTKSWRLLNNGSSTWVRGYELVHVSDHQLNAQSPAALAVEVPPNQMADFSVNMVAPNAPGTYRGYWRMRSPAGTFFGDLIWVEIVVAGEGTPAGTPVTTPGGTAAPTQAASPTPSGSTTVSNVTISIDTPTVTAACPYSYGISAGFTLSQAATVTYQLEAGSDTPGFQFTLPGAQTLSFPAGTQQISFSLSITNSGSGWVRLHITAPQDVISNDATFNLTCQ